MTRKLLAIVIVSTCIGCKNQNATTITNEAYEPLPPVGHLYPRLLPSERRHNITIRTKNIPPSLTETDLSDIMMLAARMPGLIRYEILAVFQPRSKDDLAMDPNAEVSRVIKVYMPGTVLLMEKQDNGIWQLRTFWMYAN
jgi:hypothetical protein